MSLTGNGNYDLQTTNSLKAHTRVVSDLNWHPKEPDIIASCSIDTFIHIWDIRDQRRPCLSLSAVGKYTDYEILQNKRVCKHLKRCAQLNVL